MPWVQRHLADDPSWAIVTPPLVVSGERLLAAAEENHLFTGFDEIWVPERLPVSPPPEDVVLVAPNVFDVVLPDAVRNWLSQSGYRLGLGDGDGLNYVGTDPALARQLDLPIIGPGRVARDFVAQLKTIVPEDEIRLHPVRFDPDLYDINVEHDGWGITLSLDKRGESFGLLLDDYVIDRLSESEALAFIAALTAGRAVVRVSTVPIFGRIVSLEVELGSSRLSIRRNWGSGLADWERRLLES
jgi:hypothetical protein